jgi:hypothetical protein
MPGKFFFDQTVHGFGLGWKEIGKNPAPDFRQAPFEFFPFIGSIFNDIIKSQQPDGFVKSSKCKARKN